jgi:hypothetical protein
MSRGRSIVLDHDFQPVAGHPDDDECTYRSDGTDATYCGEKRAAHNVALDEYTHADWAADQQLDRALRARPRLTRDDV